MDTPLPSLVLSAPAKVNLTLRVVGKREDGFHELETLMVPVPALADTLTFTPAEHYTLTCDTPGVPLDESNLVTKAVRAYEAAAGITVTHQIALQKRIPHGAGLGGGSSDAATTLLGLNQLYNTALRFPQLHTLATALGSDVPFFLYQSPCMCRGRGELIEPLDAAAAFTLCLLKPAFGVSTPDAFKRWKTSRPLAEVPYAPQHGPYGPMFNDLERPVFEKHLFLAQCKQWLLQQPEVQVAQMSGSGSTMLAVVSNITEGQALLERAKAELDPTLFTWCGEL